MICEIRGDLVGLAKKGLFDVIIHGCNCMHTMGGGIARIIRDEFPDAYKADLDTEYGDPSKLGKFSSCVTFTPRNIIYDFDEKKILEYKGKFDKSMVVANAYTQYTLGKDLKIWALAAALTHIKCKYPNRVYGIPLIGCGIAGGEWNKIKVIIEIIFSDEKAIIVHWDK